MGWNSQSPLEYLVFLYRAHWLEWQSYLLGFAALSPIYGRLTDMIGRKIVLQIGVFLFLAFSAMCGAAQNMPECVLTSCLSVMSWADL